MSKNTKETKKSTPKEEKPITFESLVNKNILDYNLKIYKINFIMNYIFSFILCIIFFSFLFFFYPYYYIYSYFPFIFLLLLLILYLIFIKFCFIYTYN